MKKLYLIKNPELFQGKKYLRKNKKYFEGWYFKNTSSKNNISFIPGINITENEKKAFIQIITNNNSYFVNYSIKDFKFNNNPFYIKIGNNFFSKEGIHLDIKDESLNLIVNGDIRYKNSKNIKTNYFSPNIMGPFSYVLFMECNHAILSMRNRVDGIVNINDNNIIFNNDKGYIEKDWGTSFPKSYIWIQGNNFKEENVSFMLSIANIPFKIFSFKGIISSLIINNKEYRFATYNGTKIIKYDIDNNNVNIILKKRKYLLEIKLEVKEGFKLLAPVKGKMNKEIIESINSVVDVTLRKDDNIIFSDISINCGLEIVL